MVKALFSVLFSAFFAVHSANACAVPRPSGADFIVVGNVTSVTATSNSWGGTGVVIQMETLNTLRGPYREAWAIASPFMSEDYLKPGQTILIFLDSLQWKVQLASQSDGLERFVEVQATLINPCKPLERFTLTQRVAWVRQIERTLRITGDTKNLIGIPQKNSKALRPFSWTESSSNVVSHEVFSKGGLHFFLNQ